MALWLCGSVTLFAIFTLLGHTNYFLFFCSVAFLLFLLFAATQIIFYFSALWLFCSFCYLQPHKLSFYFSALWLFLLFLLFAATQIIFYFIFFAFFSLMLKNIIFLVAFIIKQLKRPHATNLTLFFMWLLL